MFVPCFVVHCFVSVVVLQSREIERERAGCFTSFWWLVTVSVLCLFLILPLVSLQCVIVVYFDHAHLPYSISTCDFQEVDLPSGSAHVGDVKANM